jgi:hypothetical protein
MKTFDQCCKEVGLDINESPPKLKNEWVAYVGGKVTHCTSMNDAISKSSLYENVISQESKDLHSLYFLEREENIRRAVILFENSLRNECYDLSYHDFNICYEEAKYGLTDYDCIAAKFERLVKMLKKLDVCAVDV